MNKGYSVDDILNEIQVKRASSSGAKPNIEFKRDDLSSQFSEKVGSQSKTYTEKKPANSSEPSMQSFYKQQYNQNNGQHTSQKVLSNTFESYKAAAQKSQPLKSEELSSDKQHSEDNADIFSDFANSNANNDIRNSRMMFDTSYFKINCNAASNEKEQQPINNEKINVIESKAEFANDVLNKITVEEHNDYTENNIENNTENNKKLPGFKFKVNLPENISDDLPTQMNIPVQQKPADDDTQSTRHIDLSYGFSSNTEQQSYSFTNSRQQKMQEFVMQNIADDENEPENVFEEPQVASNEDDYNSPEDKATVLSDIRSVNISLFTRFIFSCFGFILLTYLSFAVENTFMPLPQFIWPEENMKMFLIVNFAIIAVTTLVCNATIVSGISSLFKLKPNNDTSAALAVLLSLIQGAALIFQPERYNDSSVHIYLNIAAMSLLFNTIGKMLLVKRISRNFDVVSAGGDKLAFSTITNADASREFTRGQNIEEPVIAYPIKAGFLTSFLTEAYSEDYNEGFFGKTVTAMSLMGSVMVSLTTILIKGDIYFALTTFSALMCVCSALSTTLTSNLPLNKASASLTRYNAQIAGYGSIEKYADTNALLIDSNLIFPESSIIMHGLKVFDQSKIDEAIIDAASVVSCCQNHLRGIFLKVLDGKESMLKNVDSVVYEDTLGISAWVDGKRVLIGNRDLMLHHGVETPTKEFEMKFIRDGREVLYLSNSGQLTAMFIISYNKTEEIEYEINRLAKHNISLLVHCTDPNLTSLKISEIYNYPAQHIKILTSKLHSDYKELTKPKEKVSSQISVGSEPINVLRTLNAIFTVKSSAVLSTLIQFVGIIIGYAIISYFAFMGDLSVITFSTLMFYQLFWAIISTVIPNFKRY